VLDNEGRAWATVTGRLLIGKKHAYFGDPKKCDVPLPVPPGRKNVMHHGNIGLQASSREAGPSSFGDRGDYDWVKVRFQKEGT
jgi:hypothetical protein